MWLDKCFKPVQKDECEYLVHKNLIAFHGTGVRGQNRTFICGVPMTGHDQFFN